MENLRNVEIIQLNTIDGQLVAMVSYQDITKTGDMNNGYSHTVIPVNIRPLQYSVRDNLLVDQSVKSYAICAGPGYSSATESAG